MIALAEHLQPKRQNSAKAAEISVEQVHGDAVEEVENLLRCNSLLGTQDSLRGAYPKLERALREYAENRTGYARDLSDRTYAIMPVSVSIPEAVTQLVQREQATVNGGSSGGVRLKRSLNSAVAVYKDKVDEALGLNRLGAGVVV